MGCRGADRACCHCANQIHGHRSAPLVGKAQPVGGRGDGSPGLPGGGKRLSRWLQATAKLWRRGDPVRIRSKGPASRVHVGSGIGGGTAEQEKFTSCHLLCVIIQCSTEFIPSISAAARLLSLAMVQAHQVPCAPPPVCGGKGHFAAPCSFLFALHGPARQQCTVTKLSQCSCCSKRSCTKIHHMPAWSAWPCRAARQYLRSMQERGADAPQGAPLNPPLRPCTQPPLSHSLQ